MRSKVRLLFITCAVLLAIPAIALADQINADGDIVAPNNQTTVNLGDVDPGQTLTPKVSFQLNCNSQQHANPGGTISLDFNSGASSAAVTSATNASISVPSTWPADSTNCGSVPNVNDLGDSNVTITAPKAPGAASVLVTYNIVAPTDANGSTGIQGSSTRSVTYTMNVRNLAPSISSIDGAGSVTEGDQEIYTINASDPNATTLSYGLTVVSGDATVVSGGNTSTPTVKFNSPGDVVLRASVNDGVNPAVTLDKTVTVASANTAPVVSVTGVTDGNSYEFGSVPTIGCSVVDAEDTGESATPQFDKTGLTNGLGNVTVTCSYKDTGGLSDSDEVSYTIVDTGKPVITDLGATADATGTNGWYTSAVTNTFKAQDYDANGNTGAGFAGETNPYNFTKGSGTTEGSAVKIASGTVSDVAGNEGTSINSAAFQIDLSNPSTPTFNGGPAAGSSPYFGSVPAEPTCSSSDDVSGLKDCVVTGYSTAVGSHTMTATATDKAGRTATETRSYTVLAWTTKGFYQPVDMNGVYNTVKGGATVPLKFELFAGSELTDTSAIKSLQATQITCESGATVDDIETVATGGTSLRYDSTGGQYIYNWQTPKKPGNCYKVTVAAQDLSTTITAYFKLK